MDTTMKVEAVGMKKAMPATLEDFRMAAAWLARASIRAGRSTVALLGGPDKDDAEAGVALGYRDGRDQ